MQIPNGFLKSDFYNEAILPFQGVIFLVNLKQNSVYSLDIVPAAFPNSSAHPFVLNVIPYKTSVEHVISAQDDKENGPERK